MLRVKRRTNEFLEKFNEDGYVLMKSVVPWNLLGELQSRIDHLEYRQPHDDWHPSFRFKHVFNRDPWWLPWLDLPEVVSLAEAVMGQDCHIIGNTAWKSLPGHLGSPTHIDYIPHQLSQEQVKVFTWPTFICTAHFFPHHLTEELGPTKVIAGSHRFGGNFWGLHRYESVFPEPGDCLFFRSDLLHGGGPNTTADQTRYLLQVHYAQRWIAQRWAQPGWEWNPAVLSAATDRQLRLLGKHPRSNYD